MLKEGLDHPFSWKPSFLTMGDKPADRVKILLGKLHSIENSKYRGSQVSNKSKLLLNKFIQQVDQIFKNLPKPME